MIQVEAFRVSATAYHKVDQSEFSDPISALIDDQRRTRFEAAGGHSTASTRSSSPIASLSARSLDSRANLFERRIK